MERLWQNFVALRAKTYAYLIGDGSDHKRAKGTKKCIVKRTLMFEYYIDSSFNDKFILKSQSKFKSGCHNVYTE